MSRQTSLTTNQLKRYITGYPAVTVPLPSSLSLEEICTQYPNHLIGSGLDCFMGVKNPRQIFDAMPPDARGQSSTATRAHNFMERRVGARKKKLIEAGTYNGVVRANVVRESAREGVREGARKGAGIEMVAERGLEVENAEILQGEQEDPEQQKQQQQQQQWQAQPDVLEGTEEMEPRGKRKRPKWEYKQPPQAFVSLWDLMKR